MKPIVNRAFLKTIEEIFHSGQLSWDAQQRLRHGHGHTQEDVYSINFGVGIGRVPDLVVFPESVRQVERLIESAVTCDVCLIPYGGGTNVSQALRCPEVESRMIVSVDISRMDKIRWVDPENRLACIEAGAVGRHIEAALGHHGLCLGHEPDSMEFSTLGGWIATKASGMKRNQYGNIEDITLDVEAVSASGVLAFTPNIAPRQSVGSDPKTFIFGSEGNTCIITAAVVKLRPLPAVRYYGSFVFPCFESGIQFMKEMSQESVQPASIRLVDNMQLRFSQALKPTPTLWASLKSRFEAKYLGLVKGFNLHEMAACTLVFEGKKMDVQRQQQIVHKKAKKFHGLEAGAENGRRGYEMTFAIAYIRDCVMSLGCSPSHSRLLVHGAMPWGYTKM
ncbi:FAD-binding domain-containing protein [Penicillium soppii]|uniref:FAD-binding domain-containing protein n=1 Tax=Penicillium soppii TaxID=69789 RepID=UPI0025469A3C|nr:FAD-binding domain-containing protein [Penicillium soppii]KAJ5865295.1 FAD-binding domain-containing protein [Penicillium soppii]